MKKNKITLILIIITSALFIYVDDVQASCQIKSGCSYTEGRYCSVTNKQLTWISQFTKYTQVFTSAVTEWNNKKLVRNSSGFDVKVKDYYEVSSFAGDTITGQISFNTYVMDTYTPAQKKGTAMHELGHALGLAHRDVNQTQAIMSTFGPHTSAKITSLDMQSYNCLWK